MTTRKANLVIDSIVVIVTLLVFSMAVFFGWQAFSEVNIDIQNDLTSNESVQVMQTVETRYPPLFDSLFAFIFIGLWAAGVVAAYFSNDHPLVFGLFMVIMVFILIASAMFSNYFEETFQDENLDEISADFPITTFIMTHLLQFTIGVVLTIAIALLGKNQA